MTALRTWMTGVLALGCIGAGSVLGADPAPPADLGAAIIDKVYGDVLLRDEDLGVVIAVKRVNGKITSVQIDNYKNAVNLRLDARDEGRPPQVTYIHGTLRPPVVQWIDFNADGIFDLRTAIGRWPDWEQGPFAFHGGRWIAMRRLEKRQPGDDRPEDHPGAMLEGKPYRFNLAAGKWEAQAAQLASPATRPAR